MQSTPIRIGTRGSPLALAQAREVRQRIADVHGMDVDAIEIVVIRTSGDRIQDRPLAEVGGKGLFTKEIEEALTEGRIELAVHSSKDMPTVIPGGLLFDAFLPREDVRDVFLSRRVARFSDLPPGAVVGTASPRRQALVKRLRPDIEVVSFRGNVQTRIRKLEAGDVDATLLALAGLKRLGLEDEATEVLDLEDFPPAVGQGAIGIERRIADERMAALLAPVSDPATATCLAAERALLGALDGSCRTPIAGYAELVNGQVRLRGLIISPDGETWRDMEQSAPLGEAEQLGAEIGAKLKEWAGPDFFSGLV